MNKPKQNFHAYNVGVAGIRGHHTNCPEEVKPGIPAGSKSQADAQSDAFDATMQGAEAEEVSPQCFRGDTIVWTRRGLQKIRTLSVGDEVLVRLELTGELCYRTVNGIIETSGVWGIDVCVSGTHGSEWIGTTEDHPFWVRGVGWVRAAELQVGQLLELAEGGTALFEGVLPAEVSIDAYNIEVDDSQPYFVGMNGVLVRHKVRAARWAG